MTPCQNPHFILASFTLSCCLLETSLITAGAQTKVYFRNPKQTFRVVTIIEIGALLPLPHIFCGWIYACIWRAGDKFQALQVAGAGKKNWTIAQSASVCMGCCSQSHFSVTAWLGNNSMWLTVKSASLQRSCVAWVSSECPSAVQTPTVWAKSNGVFREIPACSLAWVPGRHWECSGCKGWKGDASWWILPLMWIVTALLLWWSLITFSLLSQNLIFNRNNLCNKYLCKPIE